MNPLILNEKHTSKKLNQHSIAVKQSEIDMPKQFCLLGKARQGMQKYHRINSMHQLGRHLLQVPYAMTNQGEPQVMDDE